MKRKMFAIALSTMLAALCLNGLAHAQTGPSGGQPGSGAPTVTPSGALSEQDLEAVIKSLDPSYKVRPSTDGQGKIYNFKITRDGWSYTMQIESFANEVWLNAELSGVISAPQSLPAGALAELLKSNFKVGPTHFAFCPMTDNSGFKLFLSRMLARQMSVDTFNAQLNDLLKVIRDTYPTWSQVK
jgi:hypothetical protein